MADNSHEGASLRIRAREPDRLLMADLTEYLYNVNLLYEVHRLRIDEGYGNVRFSNRLLNRGVQRLRPWDQLTASHIIKESPLDILVVSAAASFMAVAFFPFAKGLAELAQVPLDWSIKWQERRKLKNENDRADEDRLNQKELVAIERELKLEELKKRKLEIRAFEEARERERWRLLQEDHSPEFSSTPLPEPKRLLTSGAEPRAPRRLIRESDDRQMRADPRTPIEITGRRALQTVYQRLDDSPVRVEHVTLYVDPELMPYVSDEELAELDDEETGR